MSKEKVVISAKRILDDINSGMDDEGLMSKYHISYRQLQKLYRKLIAEGYISAMELSQRLAITKSQVQEAFKQVDDAIKELD